MKARGEGKFREQWKAPELDESHVAFVMLKVRPTRGWPRVFCTTNIMAGLYKDTFAPSYASAFVHRPSFSSETSDPHPHLSLDRLVTANGFLLASPRISLCYTCACQRCGL
jgi:hypothetical protein